MSFFRFLRDRIPAVLIYTAVTALTVIFLYATRCGNTAVAVTILLYILSGAIILLWDYFRRRSFYARTISALDELEQKYLISEMLPDADFADGEILCELMTETCRSMYENVAAHKRSSDDFREFIELWVHEIKLPVAALLLMCHNDGGKAAEYREQIKRIDDCIENVLFYTRSENAEKDYIIKDVLLSRAFNAAATKNISALRKRGVSIETDGLDTAVMTDGKWLEYILGQFMSNSLKYFSPELSAKYSKAPDYFERASRAVIAMTEQAGELEFSPEGKLIKGTVIRHLVLPGCRKDSMELMRWIAEKVPKNRALVSIMNQYTPFPHLPEQFPELRRRVTKMEYNSVVKLAGELGLEGFTQERSSASAEYVPDFDLDGIV